MGNVHQAVLKHRDFLVDSPDLALQVLRVLLDVRSCSVLSQLGAWPGHAVALGCPELGVTPQNARIHCILSLHLGESGSHLGRIGFEEALVLVGFASLGLTGDVIVG